MARKRKYTSGQKKAYYSGMGYAAGYKRKRIPFKRSKNKTAFKRGFARGSQKVAKYKSL